MKVKKLKIEIVIEANEITDEQLEKVSEFVFNGFTDIPYYKKVGKSFKKNFDNPNIEPIKIPSVKVYKEIII